MVFLFLGRQGGLGQFVLELARTARDYDVIDPSHVIARSSRVSALLEEDGERRFELSTCDDRPLRQLVANFPAARKALLAQLARVRPAAVVALMPHAWTPLLAPALKRLGILYVSVVHDAARHPGDRTAFLTPWLLRETKHADVVVTLSDAVADRLVGTRRVEAARLLRLFHPDLHYGGPAVRCRREGEPLRLLFFGRILPYKGLPLLVDAIERLRAEGVGVQLGVAGAGHLGRERRRLAALGAEVVNRWIADDEVGRLLARYDAVALPYVEASQSGVAAAAYGSRSPVVAMPVGGLIEQVVDGRTGILARQADAPSLAEAIRRLALDPGLCNELSRNLSATAGARSMQRFLTALTAEIARRATAPAGVRSHRAA